MPVISTLGALTTFKGTENALYWAVTFEAISALVYPALTTFVESNNSTSLAGDITPIASNQPQYIKISPGSSSLPTILYSAFYGSSSNANTEGAFEKTLFDGANNRTILVGSQEANVSGFIRTCGMIRVLDSNNSTTNAFLDPPVTPSPANSTQSRTLSSAVLNANGSVTASGRMARDPISANVFITNYSQTGTKNWSRTVLGGGILNLNGIASNNDIVVSAIGSSNTGEVGYLLPNGNSFSSTFATESESSPRIAIDTSDNLYIIAAEPTTSRDKIIKYVSSSNTVSWVNQLPTPNIAVNYSFTNNPNFYDGNVYVTVQKEIPFSKITSFIVSIDANTGVINWQNELSIQGSNTLFTFGDIKANAQGLFALGVYTDDVTTNRLVGSTLLKLPTNGDILGNGSYTIGDYGLVLDIDPGTVTISNGTANIVAGNLSVVAPNAATSTTTLTIGANTTQNYLFNDTILK
jgi:hypothetical protein